MLIMFHYLSQHLDTFIGWLVTLFASLMAACIALIPRNQRHHVRKAEKDARERQRQGEQLLRKYAQEVLPASDLSKIQILRMAHPYKLEDLYVPLFVQTESGSQSILDARIRKAEEMHDPDLYLQAELDLLEHYINERIDPVEAIRTYKQIVIVGEPGSGKTTLLRYLALQSAGKQLRDLPTLPFYIELSRFDRHKQHDLLDLLVTRLGDFVVFNDTMLIKDLLCEKMRNGQVILLLDGLDETRLGVDRDEARQAYSFLVSEIKRLASLYMSVPIVVTVRKAHYQQSSKLGGFHEVEIAGFRPEDSQTFVRKWFQTSLATHSVEKIRDLQSRLEESPRVRTLISNPLLLTLAIIVYERYLELPESRAEFYRLCVKECIEVLQIEWDARRDIRRPSLLSLHAQLHLLQEVAWHFHTRSIHLFALEELLLVIEEFLPSVAVPSDQAKMVLEQIASENGLLREQALGIYGFSHLTFQEYFAAQYLNTHRNEAELLKNLNNPWWEQVVLFYANMRDESWLLSILLGHEPTLFVPDTLFYTHLLLAGRCLAEKQSLIRNVSLREEIVGKLFDLLLTTPYMFLRERAATTLAMIGSRSVNSSLLKLLASSDPQLRGIRECISDALGTTGERQLASELVELLLQEPERSMRIVITRTLGRLGNPVAVPTLLHILRQQQEDVYVQQRIALTLAGFSEYNIVDALLHLLETPETDPMVQRGIIIALGILGDRPVAHKLLAILRDDTRDSLIRAAAAKALGKLGMAEFMPEMGLVLENQQDTIYVRQHIATAIGVLCPTERVVPYLLHTLERSTLNIEVKCSIAEALALTGVRQIAPDLLRVLHQKHLSLVVRARIVLALGYLANDSMPVLDVLQKLLQIRQPEPIMRPAVLAALGMLGTRTVKAELLQVLRKAELEQDMLLHILHALSCLSYHHAIDKQDIARQLVLLLPVEQIDRYIKENIASLLKSLSEPTELSFLFDILEDRRIDRAIRQHIAEFAGQIVDDNASVTRLRELLESTDITEDVFRAYWAADRRVRGKNF